MGNEREIKLRVADGKALKKALGRLRAKPVGTGSGRVHEGNVIFDTPQGGLAKHGQLLRIRKETPEGKLKKGAAASIDLTVEKPAMGEEGEGREPQAREGSETDS